jgi:hypothetical protein
MIRNPDGTLHVLIGGGRLYDVADPCVSWDSRRIVFSGLVHPDSSWRIYEVNADGTGLRQATFSDRALDLGQFGAAAIMFRRYDDFDPCYMPDGRIVFASTRYPSLASYDLLLTSNLYLIENDGRRLRRITTERNGGEEPVIDPVSGEIVYARWWVNRDRPSNVARHGVTRDGALALTEDIANIWQAISIRSDGSGMKLYAGFPRTREGTQTYKPALLPDGTLLSTFSPTMSLTPAVGGTGIRWFRKGADFEHHVAGMKPGSPSGIPPFATDPVPLEEDVILLSHSVDGKDFGLSLCSLDGRGLVSVLDLEGTHELEPQPLVPKPVPPVLAEEFPYPTEDLPPTEDPRTYLKNDTFRFDCMNIFTNGAVDEPMPSAPRITTGARIRFFMNVQRQNPAYPDPSIYLKDAEVFLEGGVHEHDLPADVPLFEQIVDREGRVLETPDGHFAHVTGMNFERMGAGTKCVGCHAGHSMLPVPANGSIAEWFNAGPSAIVTASSVGTLDDGKLSEPAAIVDRQARIGPPEVNWIADEGEGAEVRLSWEIPIEAREFVLYNIRNDPARNTTISVQDCEILLYYKSQLVGRVHSTGEITADGTRVHINPTDIDSATIRVLRFSGTVLSRPVAGLAEVETIARISRLNYANQTEG